MRAEINAIHEAHAVEVAKLDAAMHTANREQNALSTVLRQEAEQLRRQHAEETAQAAKAAANVIALSAQHAAQLKRLEEEKLAAVAETQQRAKAAADALQL